jgi:carbon storage regulator
MQEWHQSPFWARRSHRLKEILSNAGSILHINRRNRQIANFAKHRIEAAVSDSGPRAQLPRVKTDRPWHESCIGVQTHGNRCSFPFLVCRPDPIDLVRLTEERIMLVLSRKLGQSFRLGPDVRVTIVKIDRNSVRIGIEAPGEIPIQREEIVFELPGCYAMENEAA